SAPYESRLERRAARLQRILDAVLLLLHLRLRGSAHLDDRDAARELGQALLQLLAVEVRVGVFDLGFDLADAPLDRRRIAPAVHDRGRILRDHDTTRAP